MIIAFITLKLSGFRDFILIGSCYRAFQDNFEEKNAIKKIQTTSVFITDQSGKKWEEKIRDIRVLFFHIFKNSIATKI